MITIKLSAGAASRPRARAVALPVSEPPGKLILLVEDDERWRGVILGRLAEIPGLEVTAPTSHEETALAFGKCQYAVLLLDGTLWDGRNVCEAYGPAILSQVQGGARVLAISIDVEVCEEIAEYCTGTRQPASLWSKGRGVSYAPDNKLRRALLG